jgi:hypothetical protein
MPLKRFSTNGNFSPKGDVELFKTNVGLRLLFRRPVLGFDMFGDAAKNH